MLKVRIFVCSVLAPILLFAQQQVNIIPQPVNLRVSTGVFNFDSNLSINYSVADNGLKAAAVFFNSYVKAVCGFSLQVNIAKSKSIRLSLQKITGIGEEGYQLDVTPTGIAIKANTKAGIIYGMQSLFQTLPAIRTNAVVQIPCLEIVDYPRFKWRGMHLDVSRHFFSPDMVKEYIDLLASYKMNIFHWHLVDDQGWRIEIKKYPLLTAVGAWRVNQTDKIWGTEPIAKEGEKPTYGGYYTQSQIKEIIEYAKERNVTIIPEIEMPGHVASAIASYPSLSCSQQPQLPLTGGSYGNQTSCYCSGNDSVFLFLENVLNEMIDLFPSKYIHIGGDEVDKTDWKKCPRCQARIKAEGLKNEEGLQSYFIKRIEKYLIAKNKKLIGWDEILEGGLAPEATVMSWLGENGGIQAAKMNHDVIMTPRKSCYFNNYQAGPEGQPKAGNSMITLKTVYDYEPVPKELDTIGAKHVLGAEGCIWTEYIGNVEHLEYMALPRMPALAEVLWTPAKQKNWSQFNQRLQVLFKRYEQKGIRYCWENFAVSIKPIAENGKLMVSLSTEMIDSTIFYTTDGSIPTIKSKVYTAPIAVNESMTIKAATFLDGILMGEKPAEQVFFIHKAIGRDVIYTNPINSRYKANGPNTLTDGVRGTSYIEKNWHALFGKDLIATIDLGSEQSISTISIGSMQDYNAWIFLPAALKFETSVDGKTFTTVQTVDNTISTSEKEIILHEFKVDFNKITARFIRVSAKNIGVCPKGHEGAGRPARVFADEIIVN